MSLLTYETVLFLPLLVQQLPNHGVSEMRLFFRRREGQIFHSLSVRKQWNIFFLFNSSVKCCI